MVAQDQSVESSKSTQALVWIVVLHYRVAANTSACLNALKLLKDANFKVLLIDNGSPDNSGNQVAAEFPELDYLHLPENLGFAGGCNVGARYAVENGAQWIWFVNNDAQVEPDTLSLLLSEASQDAKAAALGAMIFTPQAGTYVPEGVGEIDFRRAKTKMRKVTLAGAEPLSCDWLSGCNLLINAAVFQSLSGFDEKYFLYFEDADLCFRLRQSGWRCLLVPSAKVFHLGGASTEGKLTIWRSYYYTRNRFLFFLSHTSGVSSFLITIAISGHLLRHALVLPFRGTKGRRQLKAEMLGWRDYLLHRLGKATCLDW